MSASARVNRQLDSDIISEIVLPTKTESRSSETQRRMYGPDGLGFKLAAKGNVSEHFLSELDYSQISSSEMGKIQQSENSADLFYTIFDVVFNGCAPKAA